MQIHLIEDKGGDLIDLEYFCGEFCLKGVHPDDLLYPYFEEVPEGEKCGFCGEPLSD